MSWLPCVCGDGGPRITSRWPRAVVARAVVLGTPDRSSVGKLAPGMRARSVRGKQAL